jgi:DNA replication and repair protein RecF
MYLEKIILTNFKNYESQSLALNTRLNAFVGLNGMGKTNMLDAIYYLCMTKSYFLSSDSDVQLRGSDFMRLEGHFNKNNHPVKIAAKVQARKKKIIEKNDVPYKGLSEHIGLLPVVMVAPDDTDLVKDGSEERRRFIDNTLSQLDNQYLLHLVFYNKILEQRNALLKNAVSTEGEYTPEVQELIPYYEQQMLNPAQYIFDKRQAFIHELDPIFNDLYQKISGNIESVKLIYESQLLTDSLQNLLHKNREKDRYLQRTTQGIHRDDLSFEMGGKALKKFGSQGQLKSFVVALKLAQYELLRGVKNAAPILLLDDIFDKLDENRVQNLLQLIVNQSFGQIFITDTHEDRVEKLFNIIQQDYAKFEVINGKIII